MKLAGNKGGMILTEKMNISDRTSSSANQAVEYNTGLRSDPRYISLLRELKCE